VDAALRDKIEDDALEMAAFMRQLMEWYLIGPQYSGYDGVAFINSTQFLFEVVTPELTGDAVESTDDSGLNAPEMEPLHRVYSDYIIIGAVMVALCCCALAAVFVFCCRSQSKLKRELTATQHQVTRLKSLSHFEGAHRDPYAAEGAEDGSVPDSVGQCAPDGVSETMPQMIMSAVAAQSVSAMSSIAALPSMASNGGYQPYHSPVPRQNMGFSRQSSPQTVVSQQSAAMDRSWRDDAHSDHSGMAAGHSNLSRLMLNAGSLPESQMPLKGIGVDGPDGVDFVDTDGDEDGDEELDAMYVKPMASPKGDDPEDLYKKPRPKATKGATPRNVERQQRDEGDVGDEALDDDMAVIEELKATPNGNPFLMEMAKDGDGADGDGFECFNEENPFIEHDAAERTQY